MQQQRNSGNNHSTQAQEAKIIRLHPPVSPIDQEFELQIQSLRALIGKLHPAERQQYFDAFLDHLLSIDIVYPPNSTQPQTASRRPASLSVEERALIRELSETVQQLHKQAGDQD